MTARLLLDEHIEHEVYHRLLQYGHHVEHVHFHGTLQRGDDDATLADYSLENEMIIVTYDDDFEQRHTGSDYWGVLFFRTTSGPQARSLTLSIGFSIYTTSRRCNR